MKEKLGKPSFFNMIKNKKQKNIKKQKIIEKNRKKCYHYTIALK